MANKKTVIVTGSSQGIGAAIVQAFMDCGYKRRCNSQLSIKQCMQIESVRERRTVYIGNDCLRGTDPDESPT